MKHFFLRLLGLHHDEPRADDRDLEEQQQYLREQLDYDASRLRELEAEIALRERRHDHT
jgi:hypothetical protein